jgi:hypothetical protein
MLQQQHLLVQQQQQLQQYQLQQYQLLKRLKIV